MRIDSSGNVGIGTATIQQSASNRTVTTINGTTSAILNLAVSDTLKSYLYADTSGGVYETSGNNIIVAGGANYIGFNTNGSERMRITSGGFLKASNTGSYLNATAYYHELYNTIGGNQILQASSSATVNPYGIGINFTAVSPNNTSLWFIRAEDSTTARFYVYSNGNVVNTNNSYGAISDAKLKENVTDASPKLDDLLQVKIRNYQPILEMIRNN